MITDLWGRMLIWLEMPWSRQTWLYVQYKICQTILQTIKVCNSPFISKFISKTVLYTDSFVVCGRLASFGRSTQCRQYMNFNRMVSGWVYEWVRLLILLIIYLFILWQFTTPSFPGDPFLGPYPITFITYEVTSTDGTEHKVEIYYDNTGEVC